MPSRTSAFACIRAAAERSRSRRASRRSSAATKSLRIVSCFPLIVSVSSSAGHDRSCSLPIAPNRSRGRFSVGQYQAVQPILGVRTNGTESVGRSNASTATSARSGSTTCRSRAASQCATPEASGRCGSTTRIGASVWQASKEAPGQACSRVAAGIGLGQKDLGAEQQRPAFYTDHARSCVSISRPFPFLLCFQR